MSVLSSSLPSVLWLKSGSFLYILYLAVDAIFKLKGKDRKLDDIELMPGYGVFVEESAYQTHLKGYVEQPEVRSTFQLE